jgi:hypothetical protein
MPPKPWAPTVAQRQDRWAFFVLITQDPYVWADEVLRFALAQGGQMARGSSAEPSRLLRQMYPQRSVCPVLLSGRQVMRVPARPAAWRSSCSFPEM